MEFKHFNQKIQQQFSKMSSTGKLFRSSVTGQQVWNVYLNSFKPENNLVFRDPESSEHNCNCCKNFIRRYGNIVCVNEQGSLESIFSNIGDVEEYADSVVACNKLLLDSKIQDVFFETFNELDKNLNYESCKKNQEVFQLGVKFNLKRYTKEEADKFGKVNTADIYEFEHFNIQLPKLFVDVSGKSVEAIMGEFRDSKGVFMRAMETISEDTLKLVRDLINQGSLLDGTSHLYKIEQILPLKVQFNGLPKSQQDNWCWVNSYKLPFAKFRNELIGVLCSELAEGKELNEAVTAWNKRVDPANYMKAVAPITKRQIEEAKKFVEENGYEESFNRRFATINDIKASEILHVNTGKGDIKQVSIFDGVKSTSTRHKRSEFDKVEEVTIEKFMKDILPTCTSIEAYLENRMSGNMVSLTTANLNESKPIFKWSNNYSWTFNGNLAGKSQIKEYVKERGGKVDSKVRVSIHFPLTTDDYDLHCYEPNGGHISYLNVRTMQHSSGMLDLDAQGIDGKFSPEKRVENLTYSDLSKMPKGIYDFRVHNYLGRGLHTKFNVEVEIEGDITLLEFDVVSSVRRAQSIGKLHFDGNTLNFVPENCSVIESKSVSKQIYSLESNQFHKVNLVCLSPNHWGENNVGNKHYFFMLDDCKCETSIRSFHAENLIPELANHRKVLEVLGDTTMIESTDKQLSGLGFNSTVKDELIVKLGGSHKRIVKIKF